MSRRHDSLIPLSHQHQHALAFALTIKRRIGMEKGEPAWFDLMVVKLKEIFANELNFHFAAEEQVLFAEMERHLGKLHIVDELVAEHQELRKLAAQFQTSPSFYRLSSFAELLEAHIRKEERVLFTEFESRMPEEEARRLQPLIEARLCQPAQKAQPF
jgi:iron-sulfur cluster repair protein YtfE (RIC family)